MRASSLYFLIFVISSSTAHAGNKTPIRYKVDGNNRIFFERESERYTSDLNRYVRCSASAKGRPVDSTPECDTYRRQGTIERQLVPNLRLGAIHDEYKIRYDKVRHEFPQRYALDGRRKIILYIDETWVRLQAPVPVACTWIVVSALERKQFTSADCNPIPNDIELSLSDAGNELSWTATIQLNVELANGTKLDFEAPAVVQDFLIVAMGDSFASGEGNPERNRTAATPAQWMDYRCHRSLFSYPVMVASTLALADPRHSVTLVHVACSGSKTTEGVLGEYAGIINREQAIALWKGRAHTERHRIKVPKQWKQYGTELIFLDSQVAQVQRLLVDGNRRRKPNVLLMSIGVNDMGFVDLLEKLALENCGHECLNNLRRWRNSEAAKCDDSTDRLKRSFDCLDQLLSKTRTAIEDRIAPQQTYLVKYPNPLRDEKNNLCMSMPHHEELLKGLLGMFGDVVRKFGPLKLSQPEIQYAEAEFFDPIIQAQSRLSSAPHWASIDYRPVENNRGFCARPRWYHTYLESKLRQHLVPGSSKDLVGTLHPNAIGHEHIMVRVLLGLNKDRALHGHNLSLLEQSDIHRNPIGADGYEGIGWFIGNLHREEVSRYFRY